MYVFFTEWCALVGTACLCELYDSLRMWFITTLMREKFSRLYLDTVVGGPAHVAYFQSNLARYETIDWNDLNMVPLAKNVVNQVHWG